MGFKPLIHDSIRSLFQLYYLNRKAIER
jgi:hypothetical protein